MSSPSSKIFRALATSCWASVRVAATGAVLAGEDGGAASDDASGPPSAASSDDEAADAPAPAIVPFVDGDPVMRRAGGGSGAIVDTYFAPGVDAVTPTVAYTIRWETGEVERDIFHAELQLVPQGRRRVVVNYAALAGGRA